MAFIENAVKCCLYLLSPHSPFRGGGARGEGTCIVMDALPTYYSAIRAQLHLHSGQSQRDQRLNWLAAHVGCTFWRTAVVGQSVFFRTFQSIKKTYIPPMGACTEVWVVDILLAVFFVCTESVYVLLRTQIPTSIIIGLAKKMICHQQWIHR